MTLQTQSAQSAEQTKSSRIGRVIDLNQRTITFTVPGVAEPLVLNMDAVAESCRTYAMYHGFSQRIGDAAAIERAASGGKTASPETKWNAMKALVDHYNAGQEAWSPKREDRIGSDELLLAQALTALRPEKSPEAIRAFVSGLTKAQRTALMTQDEGIRAKVAEIQGQITQGVDTEALLAGL